MENENVSVHDIIYNNNTKNIPKDNIYQAFNQFIFSDDIKIMGKMLHRYDFFQQTKHLPGDIVEVGVFKGSGVASFSKFLEIFCPNTNKKVIGFDFFDPTEANLNLQKDSKHDQDSMKLVYSRLPSENDRTLEAVQSRLDAMNLNPKYLLVPGDVEQSIPAFTTKSPGFRISLLYIDVDIERPTYFALKHLWDRILPGGIIVFDEYEYHTFTESCGVEKFLKENDLPYEVVSTQWMAPTAFLVKKKW